MCRRRENLDDQSRSPFDASLGNNSATIGANKDEIRLDHGRGGQNQIGGGKQKPFHPVGKNMIGKYSVQVAQGDLMFCSGR